MKTLTMLVLFTFSVQAYAGFQYAGVYQAIDSKIMIEIDETRRAVDTNFTELRRVEDHLLEE
jgi:hypothetical protein